MKSSAQTFFVSMEIISKHQRNGDLAKFLHNIKHRNVFLY